MPSSRGRSAPPVNKNINAALAKDPGVGPKGDSMNLKAQSVLGGIQPVSEEDKLLAGKYVRRYAVREGLKMHDIQDVLDMLDVP